MAPRCMVCSRVPTVEQNWIDYSTLKVIHRVAERSVGWFETPGWFFGKSLKNALRLASSHSQRIRCSTKPRALHHRATPHDRTRVRAPLGTLATLPDRGSSLAAELREKKMFASSSLTQQTAVAGSSASGLRGSKAIRARAAARRPVRVSAVATEQVGKVRFDPQGSHHPRRSLSSPLG